MIFLRLFVVSHCSLNIEGIIIELTVTIIIKYPHVFITIHLRTVIYESEKG